MPWSQDDGVVAFAIAVCSSGCGTSPVNDVYALPTAAPKHAPALAFACSLASLKRCLDAGDRDRLRGNARANTGGPPSLPPFFPFAFS